MLDFLTNSLFFGVAVSLAAYEVGSLLKKKFKSPLLNPLLISIILVIAILVALDADYQSYNISAKYLSYLLTPATVCLAIPLYEQIEKLKSNWKAIVAGIVSGIISCVLCVYAFSLIFGLTHAQYVTLLPKSITTAIGMDVSTELGGITTITVAVIIITGVFGNIIGEPICKLFHITEPVAKGVGMGSSAHAIGTAKAMEMGEVEGAISSLSIAVTGLLTVIAASIAANLY